MKNKFIREYFSFSVRERKGFVIIVIILFTVIITNIIITNHKDGSKYNFGQFENDIDIFMSSQIQEEFETELFHFDPNTVSREDLKRLGLSPKAISSIFNYREKGGKFYKPEDLEKIYNVTTEEYNRIKDYIQIECYSLNKKKNYKKSAKKKEYNLFDFDPNSVSTEDMNNLGLKSWQVENIVKYRNNGNIFKTPEDLKKIYGIDEKTYKRLSPYIKIPELLIVEENVNSVGENSFTITINTATETELQKLYGIGPVYSKRIVEYREKLGGFINVNQLMEVYGFTEDLLTNIQKHLIIDKDNIRKINLNTAEYKDLISHPYIDKDNTIKILNYRKFAGEIKSFKELLDQKAIDKNFYDKLMPYFTTE
ncbi:MAG: helix-hairpin-helix domain-containing protein [Bacteroidales bacterium]|jgi:competence ComEA-like helix-hairpin-helix protein|nr:helix-hairpin-helix domain-containing protein [Bacteroidales bacterium]